MSQAIATVAYEDGVAVVSVSNPPVNTINAGVREELRRAVAEISARKDVRAMVLICEGSTFFSGADIGEFSGPPKEEEYRRLFNAIEGLPFPVVAAMHGTVMGGGLELAFACHYRIAAPGTRFGLPEVTLGLADFGEQSSAGGAAQHTDAESFNHRARVAFRRSVPRHADVDLCRGLFDVQRSALRWLQLPGRGRSAGPALEQRVQ
jgi:hypothetical protein